MCLASLDSPVEAPVPHFPWQLLWWWLITHSDSQGARHPTMRGESVESSSTDPNSVLLSGLSPAQQHISYSWHQTLGTHCIHIAVCGHCVYTPIFFMLRKTHPLTRVTDFLPANSEHNIFVLNWVIFSSFLFKDLLESFMIIAALSFKCIAFYLLIS